MMFDNGMAIYGKTLTEVNNSSFATLYPKLTDCLIWLYIML